MEIRGDNIETFVHAVRRADIFAQKGCGPRRWARRYGPTVRSAILARMKAR